MDVTVRFVPKNRSSAPRREFFGTARSQGIMALSPAKRFATSAIQQLANLGVQAQTTARDRLEAKMTSAEVQNRFGVELDERKLESTDASIVFQQTYMTPRSELKLPAELQDTIDFAYIPTPVEFFSQPLYKPPVESIYHLSLEDVRLRLNAAACHRRGWTGAGIRVAMADSGFFLHPWYSRNAYSLVPTHAPGSGDPAVDESGHGTGEAANIFTVAPDCTVFGVKHGNTTVATLEACMDQNPHVMTNSWGWSVDTQSKEQLKARDPNFYNELVDVETAVLEAISKGICVFFSAGNGHHAFPACMKEVISVGGATVLQDGSLEASGYASSFRSKLYPGRKVPDFCGIVGMPGTPPLEGHIMLPVPPDSELDGSNFSSGRTGLGWGIFSGTSAASPQAAGVAALVKGISKQLTPEAIRSILMQSATDVTMGTTALGDKATAGHDDATGTGFIDAFSACQIAATTS